MSHPQELDHAAFERVWRRVMPQDRPDCPIELNTASDPPTAEAPVSAMNALATQTMPAPLPAPLPPSAGESPYPCLGERSAAALPTLAALTDMAREGRQIYAALTRPNRGRTAQTAPFRAFLGTKEQQLRRLRTAYFLIAGTEPEGEAPTPRHTPSLPLTLRGRYHAEQSFALACLTAVSHTSDSCLIELYRSLASQSQALAGEIRELLEEL